jgi:uncharacterized protein YjiS (DUF1127 family)
MTTDTSRNGHNALENRLSRSPWLLFKAAALTLAIAANRMSGKLIGISKKRCSRQALSELTDQQLDDIGLTRSEVKVEAAKSSFWF